MVASSQAGQPSSSKSPARSVRDSTGARSVATAARTSSSASANASAGSHFSRVSASGNWGSPTAANRRTTSRTQSASSGRPPGDAASTRIARRPESSSPNRSAPRRKASWNRESALIDSSSRCPSPEAHCSSGSPSPFPGAATGTSRDSSRSIRSMSWVIFNSLPDDASSARNWSAARSTSGYSSGIRVEPRQDRARSRNVRNRSSQPAVPSCGRCSSGREPSHSPAVAPETRNMSSHIAGMSSSWDEGSVSSRVPRMLGSRTASAASAVR